MEKSNTPLQVAASLSSAASIAYITWTLKPLFIFRGRGVKGVKEMSFPNKLIAYEVLLNLIMCLVTVVGRCNKEEGCGSVHFCEFQGFVVQFTSFASHLWMMFIAWKMYQWIVQRKNEDRLRKKLPSTYASILALSLVNASIVLANKKIGLADCSAWCAISVGKHMADGSAWRAGANYVWLLASWAGSIFVVVLVYRNLHLRRNVAGHSHHSRQGLEAAVQNRLTLYIAVFLLCWFFPFINAIVEFFMKPEYKTSNSITPDAAIALAWLAAFMTPLHGFFNCLVFNGHLDGAIPFATKCAQRLGLGLGLTGLQEDGDVGGAGGPKKYTVNKNRSSVFAGFNALAAYAGGMGGAAAAPANKVGHASVPRGSGKGPSLSVGDAGAAADASGSGGGSSPLHAHSRNTVALGSPALLAVKGAGPPSGVGVGAGFGAHTVRNGALLGMGGYVPFRYSLFITTFNLGEAKLSALYDNLGDWIIKGHDIYSVGLQECLDLERVREAIWAHLGGPEEYKMFCTEIGSDNTNLGYHGFIALTVFVRTADFDAGRVRETVRSTSAMATGKNLIIATATNKGAVGIPFQIHDASVAFLTSHLPSDQKGQCKLGKRNSAASTILKEVVLTPEDVDFDMHLQHDHVFFTGDLNYRMDPAAMPAELGIRDFKYMDAIVDACRAEKQVLGDDPQWLARKYSLLRSPNTEDAMCPKEHERLLILAAKRASHDHWVKILLADELRAVMLRGLAFTGFDEETPSFPPTYKRLKAENGCDGGCGDYSEISDLFNGFSHTGNSGAEEADEDDAQTNSTRLPAPPLLGLVGLPRSSSGSSIDNPCIQISAAASDAAGFVLGGGTPTSPDDLESPASLELGPYPAPADKAIPANHPRTLTHSHSFSSTDRHTAASVGKEKKPGAKRSDLRAPSYTDRILVHRYVFN